MKRGDKIMASINMKATIKANVGVYASATTSSKKKTTYKKGEKVVVTSIKNDSKGNTWAKTAKGWFMTYKKSSGKEFCKIYTTQKEADGTTTKTDVTEASRKYEKILNTMVESAKEGIGGSLNKTMQLFGIPYQFLPSVDCRIDEVSPEIGRKYIEEIILDAPVVTIMPGKPAFLPGAKDKKSIATAFLQAASGNLGALQTISKSMNVDALKFYDFKTDYIAYMSYVNVMCRTCAAFLELEDNPMGYRINGETVNFMNYDWKDYRWEGKPYTNSVSTVVNGAKKTAESAFDTFLNFGNVIIDLFSGKKDKKYKSVKNEKDKKKNYKIKDNHLNINDAGSDLNEDQTTTTENLLRTIHYVQFYCDPASGASENITNTSKESSLKGLFNQGSETIKDVQFMMDSGGANYANELGKLGTEAMNAVSDLLGNAVGSFNDSAGSMISRLFSTGSNIMKGENVVMPDIYANSQYSKQYQLIFHFKALYGNKTSIYMDTLVPTCHILGTVLPKATTANTFCAPVLVKAFMPGKFNCNMGLVTSVSMERSDDSRNVDGLPTEITITMDIQDLYSDLMMTPASDPILFCNNSSLIEYLAINCGLDLVDNQFSTKIDMVFNNVSVLRSDLGDNVFGKLADHLNDMILSFTSF